MNQQNEQKTISKLRSFLVSGEMDKILETGPITCQHLDYPEDCKLGFNVPYNLRRDNQAWCNKCEKILHLEGGWTEIALEFAKMKPICGCCFEYMRWERIEEQEQSKKILNK
jgi:hypothetical protein